MVYQEDVIKIALHFGGLPAADGDILRRAMSGNDRMQKSKDDFISCAQQGHTEALNQEIYRQIESFAGYSFCKAHSASYAVKLSEFVLKSIILLSLWWLSSTTKVVLSNRSLCA
jgi:DNA polymerase-3 subunit alpha/error-prone DNA polymerase